MSNFASYSGARIVGGSITIPLYGAWSGDVSLASDGAVDATSSVVLGNLTLRGTVYRQAAFGGRRDCRLVAGAGGWHKEVNERAYHHSAGVRLDTVLGDAAREVGERLGPVPGDVIGTDYVRSRGPAARVLHALAGRTWYVDPAGVTQIANWPTKTIRTDLTVISYEGGSGLVVVATEDYAAFMPGTSFSAPNLDEPVTIGGVRYRFAEDGTFRLEVLTQP